MYYALEEPTSLNTLELLPELMRIGVRAIEGDTELGLTVKNLLDSTDWDGLLARILPPFHRRATPPPPERHSS